MNQSQHYKASLRKESFTLVRASGEMFMKIKKVNYSSQRCYDLSWCPLYSFGQQFHEKYIEDVHRGSGRKMTPSNWLRKLSFLSLQQKTLSADMMSSHVWNYWLLLTFKDDGDQLSSLLPGCRTRCKQLNMKKEWFGLLIRKNVVFNDNEALK